MTDTSTMNPHVRYVRSYLAECKLHAEIRGPWIDPDRYAEELRRVENAKHLLWLVKLPLIGGSRG